VEYAGDHLVAFPGAISGGVLEKEVQGETSLQEHFGSWRFLFGSSVIASTKD